MAVNALAAKRFRWHHLAATVGPGIAALLANTDVGSILTAAQSGAHWGYRFLGLQLSAIPILYLTQELAARTGLSTGRGLAELIRERFGFFWSSISIAVLVLSCFGALVTQIAGLAGIGQLFGVPVLLTVGALVSSILAVVLTGSYQRVERIVMLLGIFQLAFVFLAWRSHPESQEFLQQSQQILLKDPDYLYLVAANLGTTVIPWAIFYQQSAIIDKGLGIGSLFAARLEIWVSAIVCQLITISIIVAAAASHSGSSASFDTVPATVTTLARIMNFTGGQLLVIVAIVGCALIAMIVASLTAAWALGEAAGYRRSLERRPLDAPWFEVFFALLLLAAGATVASGINLVRLSIAVGVGNAFLLPVVLFFLFRLARSVLPEEHRLKGMPAIVAGLAFSVVSILGLYSGFIGLRG